MQTQETFSPRESHSEAVSRVLALLCGPAPWPAEAMEEAREAVLDLASRWERHRRAHGGSTGVEMSPYLRRAVAVARKAVPDIPREMAS